MAEIAEVNPEIDAFVTDFNMWVVPQVATPNQMGHMGPSPVLVLAPGELGKLLYLAIEKWEAKKK